jgi:hypothetical protein
VTDNNVFQLAHPGTFTDWLTEILPNGARALLTQAVVERAAKNFYAIFVRAPWAVSRTEGCGVYGISGSSS